MVDAAAPTTHLAPVWFQVTDLQVASGEGCWITTVDGDRFLDFTAGIAVTSTGHCHPHVVAAIAEQAQRFIHAQVNCYRHDLLERLAARLAELAPADIDTFFFANSGAEATEGAVKLAKQATGRPNVIVFQGSFHGRTHLAMAMTTSKTGYRAGHTPLPAGVFPAPFPQTVGTGLTEDQAVEAALEGLRYLLASQTAPAETAAMILEPVLGEGGYYPAPPSFLRGIREICDEHGILFIADEVQSGFARTGRMFAIEESGVRPDVIVMAKGIASGFPIAAIGASAELMARWPVGSHGGTYGGNPIGCAAALATIDVLTADGFLEHVNARGDQLRDGLRKLAADHPVVADVRGPGLMVAVEFRDPDTGRPDAARTAAVIAHCRYESNLLLMNAGTWGNIIRFMPPLVVSEEEMALAVDAVGAAVAATA
ncbi:aspartate aminotransferase family protein [Dermatobacter hominis]|uniref:aspartate aminotransferase family protein n=1 Tax=Dermatobacter hominis TaxID=2884263 RepID=UPI001D118CCA|nr:aminotransferase class III-fold pyridoxal phosphate-dependent enzyme [Dermatobacter hominis]UDY34288.1 aminotransferase class III-fold pyridoxal phosphate-dependent enzyme [Dermatobacter hominis]